VKLKDIQLILMYGLSIVLFCGLIYGMYWCGKTFSYAIFYEDMVEFTIVEQVKTSCLK